MEVNVDIKKDEILPDEVQRMIKHYEDMGYERVKLKKTRVLDDDIFYHMVYFHPLIKGENSPFDTFFLATIHLYSWPKPGVETHCYSIDSYEMYDLLQYKTKSVREEEIEDGYAV